MTSYSSYPLETALCSSCCWVQALWLFLHLTSNVNSIFNCTDIKPFHLKTVNSIQRLKLKLYATINKAHFVIRILFPPHPPPLTHTHTHRTMVSYTSMDSRKLSKSICHLSKIGYRNFKWMKEERSKLRAKWIIFLLWIVLFNILIT